MAFLYHLVADDMRGSTLYPLFELRARHPEVYERERVKWAGRESVVSVRVPQLGVQWGDTVNLAAIEPALLVEARRRLGVSFSRLLERRVVRIPVERIEGQPAVVYDSTSHWLNSSPGEQVSATPPEEDFTPFNAGTYEELTAVPQLHLDYLARQRDRGQPALGFVFIRHVLVAGPVDISGLPLSSL